MDRRNASAGAEDEGVIRWLADEGVVWRARVLDGDEVQGVLSGAFYSPNRLASCAKPSRRRETFPLQGHLYFAVHERPRAAGCASRRLKARGMTKASRSALIRVALDQVTSTRFHGGSEKGISSPSNEASRNASALRCDLAASLLLGADALSIGDRNRCVSGTTKSRNAIPKRGDIRRQGCV